ncbi:MAG TPA: LptF/LptG family permease [Verrucomicrobiae bacterium]
MRLLDRYLLRELAVPLSYCLGAFLVFWIAFDLISNLSDYREVGLGGVSLLLYYAYRLPDLLLVIVPVGLLLGLLYTLTNLARHSELVAMRAAGISLWRLSVPYFLVGIFFSVALFVLNDVWLKNTNEKAEELLVRNKKGTTSDNKVLRNFNFRNPREGRTWNISQYHLESGAFRDAQVTWNLPDGTRQVIISKSGGFTGNTWVFTNVLQMVFISSESAPENKTVTNRMEMPLFTETPSSIRSEVKVSNSLSAVKASKAGYLSLEEMRDYIHMHPDMAPDTKAKLLTRLHTRLAAPWTCLVAIFIALPFGAVTGRRNVFGGVASSIIIFFAFYVMQRFGMAMGTSGRLPAILAAWGPNVFFAFLGLWMTWRQK